MVRYREAALGDRTPAGNVCMWKKNNWIGEVMSADVKMKVCESNAVCVILYR